MPVYTVRTETNADLTIDTTHGVTVYPPSSPLNVAAVKTWGRPVDLTETQARELSRQDFNERRKLGSCASCFYHDKRPLVGECDRLCCSLRQMALESGVEISPYVQAAAPVAEPIDTRASCCAVRMVVVWATVGLVWGAPALLGLAGGSLACAILLLLCSRFQQAA